MEYAITKVSTKGQIVIPSSLRKDVHIGDEFLMIKEDNNIVLKNMKSLASSLKEDLIFAEKVESAWKEYDKGKFITKSKEDFLKELHAC